LGKKKKTEGITNFMGKKKEAPGSFFEKDVGTPKEETGGNMCGKGEKMWILSSRRVQSKIQREGKRHSLFPRRNSRENQQRGKIWGSEKEGSLLYVKKKVTPWRKKRG